MEYTIVEGADKMQTDEIMRLLKMTYWAAQRSEEQVKRAISHSSCYGIRLEGSGRLIGFARVISDYATSYYLCDVIIDPEYRGRGLGKALVGYVLSRPEYKGCRGFLATRDAHGLYRQFGFEAAEGRVMMRSPD